MTTYNLNVEDGTQEFSSNQNGELYHDIAIGARGDSPSGSVTISAKKPGSSVFESIPDATFDLSSLNTVQFTGAVAEYRLVISGVSGISTLTLTDTAQGA